MEEDDSEKEKEGDEDEDNQEEEGEKEAEQTEKQAEKKEKKEEKEEKENQNESNSAELRGDEDSSETKSDESPTFICKTGREYSSRRRELRSKFSNILKTALESPSTPIHTFRTSPPPSPKLFFFMNTQLLVSL